MLESVLRSLIINLWPMGLAVMIASLLEWLYPWRRGKADRLRWLHAAVLYVAGIIVAYVVLPIGLGGVALVAEDWDFGLLRTARLPVWIVAVIGILILDLSQWACHWSMHHLPLLWRVHRLHHSDATLDASTAFRFHPIETLYRFLVQAAVTMLIGIPVAVIAIYSFVTLAFDVWEHANLRSAKAFQRFSRIIITPNLHRLHHSSELRHQNGNLGTIFSLWDRIFGTYISDRELTDSVSFGLGPKNRLSFRTLANLLLDPIRKA